jgi:hypothetical protein
MITQAFKIGDRVKPTSGPYRRTEFVVAGMEGDRISVEAGKLKLAFPSKLLKPAPKPKNKALVNRHTPFAVMDEPKTTHSPPLDSLETPETIEASLLSPRIDAELKVGDRVTFQAYWWGGMREFEGEVVKLNKPKGTAIVRYEVPVEDGKPLLTRELQSTIGFFEHAKNPELESDSGGARADNLPVLSEADWLRAEIAAIKAEGTLAPDNCWVDWKPQLGGFKQVVWRSQSAIFTAIRGGGLVKSSYIGKEGSPEHSFALSAIARRNQVQKLEKRLRKLEKNANN